VKARRSLTGCVALALLAGCAAERDCRRDERRDEPEPPIAESRTGVPFLMDLPIVGWLFQHRVTER
jgi:hypothetical protein